MAGRRRLIGNQYGTSSTWTAEEDAYLLSHAAHDASAIAAALGRGLWAVRTRAKKLGALLGFLNPDKAARRLYLLGTGDSYIRQRIQYDTNGGCWLWTGGSGAQRRYGHTTYLGEQGAHRISWRIYRGEIPTGMFVCHKCDVLECVNPDHLYVGTPADNSADKVARDRSYRPRGAANVQAKLSEEQAREIIRQLAEGAHPADLAAIFGVSGPTINDIGAGRSWPHLPRPSGNWRKNWRFTPRRPEGAQR